MPKESMSVKGEVEISVRRFVADPRGSVVAQDGTRGYYTHWVAQGGKNLLTDAGRDFLLLQGYQTTGLSSNGANYIALSTDSTAPADADTTLTGEITTGGLARAQGQVSHTTGENTTRVTKVFTATATHTSVQKTGLFTASSSGTLVHEYLASAVTLAANDQLQVMWTVTHDD